MMGKFQFKSDDAIIPNLGTTHYVQFVLFSVHKKQHQKSGPDPNPNLSCIISDSLSAAY